MVPQQYHVGRTTFPDNLRKIPGATYDPSFIPPHGKPGELVSLDEEEKGLKEIIEVDKEKISETLQKDTK